MECKCLHRLNLFCKEGAMLTIIFTVILKQGPQLLILCRKDLPRNQEPFYVNINTVSILLQFQPIRINITQGREKGLLIGLIIYLVPGIFFFP